MQTNLNILDSSRVSRPCSSSGNFYGSEIRHGIFRGLNCDPGSFGVLFEALGIFVDFDFCSVEKEVPRRKMRRNNAK